MQNNNAQYDTANLNGFQEDGKMYVAIPYQFTDYIGNHLWDRSAQITLQSYGGEEGEGAGVDIVLTNMVGGNYWFDPNNGDVIPMISEPCPPCLSIARNGNESLISFPSMSSVTYSLSFTNFSGLSSLSSTWPTLVDSIIGNGSVKTFTNSTSDTNRFYRVKAQ